ncbi:MAG: heme ABC exporter ATP-binding protein CcmA [Nitrospinota bacterium]
MLKVEALSKQYGPLRALEEVSFELEGGRALTFLGPNGAGKTTLIRILALLLKPTSGSLTLEGEDLLQAEDRIRQKIGLISHSPFLYAALTPLENLLFYGRMFGLKAPRERALAVLEEVGLTARMHDPVRVLSRGMVQRLAIARAILHEPLLLLFDEPYTGLDYAAAKRLTESLAALKSEERLLILTTHNFSQGLELADRVAILRRGSCVYQGEAGALLPRELEALYLEKVSP